jgi:hypothetical protein
MQLGDLINRFDRGMGEIGSGTGINFLKKEKLTSF